MRIFLTALAGALALSSLAAIAQDQGLTSDQLVRLDGSGEGALSVEELRTFMASAFARMDGNSDGTLSNAEALVVITPAHLAAADADGDGAISEAEFDAQVARDFAAADRDADGTLD